MTTNTVFGWVASDRTIKSGSGDFTVGQSVSQGVFDIIFDTSFSDVPAVVANAVENQTNRGISIHISQINNDQVQLVVMNTSNQVAYDIDFLFTAIGPA